MREEMSKLFTVAIVVFIGCFIIYGCYWLAKTVSYHVFYEDMVRKTVVEMVRDGALKNIEQ